MTSLSLGDFLKSNCDALVIGRVSGSSDVHGHENATAKHHSKAPSWLTTFAPADALVMQEEAWNACPKCRSVLGFSIDFFLQSPYFSKFFMSIDTIHKADNGYSENVHGLSEDRLAVRQVEVIDIASAATDCWSYIVGRKNVDFSNFQSARCGRGPLLEGWQLRGLGTRLCNLLVVFFFVGANGEELIADSHLLAVAVGVTVERAIKHYASARNATATLRFLGTKLSIRPSTGGYCIFIQRNKFSHSRDSKASYGGRSEYHCCLDWSLGPSRLANFNILFRTSMSSPRVSGMGTTLAFHLKPTNNEKEI
ncbi:hypothetical protein RDI58_014698 [Solanum bulbocastanum]|uniref:Phosphatidylinositol transfer protein N-terminal domain-containing protein n=1 Tax=Solanum bulbocastanum TaxID=147425 RepID=A0AAN8TK46_SOLBU